MEKAAGAARAVIGLTEGQGGVILAHAASVVGYFCQTLAAICHIDEYPGGPCIDGVLHKLLDHGGGPLDYLACCDLVYGALIQESDLMHWHLLISKRFFPA